VRNEVTVNEALEQFEKLQTNHRNPNYRAAAGNLLLAEKWKMMAELLAVVARAEMFLLTEMQPTLIAIDSVGSMRMLKQIIDLLGRSVQDTKVGGLHGAENALNGKGNA
jgi:hypothetical protein